ncbi:MAG: cell division protein FtsA [Anaerorhabdus sp.]
MDKQIFAALEITDHEVRLIVGEFFNTRFNIIKVERVLCTGLNNYKIESEDEVIDAIKKAVLNASKKIGAPIKRVLLAIPSVNVHRYPLKVTTKVESIDHMVTAIDIQRARKKASSTRIDDELALIQTVCVKYTCNGIATRRIPLNERCDMLTIDIDLLCVDREIAFGIVGCVEKAGLEVLDVCLDSFAIAKEAAMFEQTVGQSVIVMNVSRENSTLALLAKGKLIHCDILNHGVNRWIQDVQSQVDLPTEIAAKVIKSNARFDGEKQSDYPVYVWTEGTDTHTLSEKEISEMIQGNVQLWVKEIKEKCLPILEAERTVVVLTGEGSEVQGLPYLLEKELETEVRVYVPETLGVRTGDLVACLGLFFAYKDQLPILGYFDNSVDIHAFEQTVRYRVEEEAEEESLTKKLKGMLF